MSVFYGRLMFFVLVCFAISFFYQPVIAEETPPKNPDKGYISPFKLFDNIYYVGDKWVSAYLITTHSGLILVDTLEYPYTKWLPDNIKKLGFDPSDIKLIIITHGHSDHASGAGWLEKLTGATLIMTDDSRLLMHRFFQSNSEIPAPASASIQIVKDGEKIRLGQSEFLVYTTPGHTDGAISIQLPAKKGELSFKALIFGGVGTNYQTPELADKYLASVAKLQKLHQQSPFDINLANHPHRAKLFEKVKQRTATSDPLVDSSAFTYFLQQLKIAGELRRREITYNQANKN